MFLCVLYHCLVLCSVQTSQAILTGITYMILKSECFCLCRVKSEWGTSQEKSPEFDVPSQLSSGPFRAQLKSLNSTWFRWKSFVSTVQLTKWCALPSLSENSLLQYLMGVANSGALETLSSLVFPILAWLEKSCFFSSCPTFCSNSAFICFVADFLHLQMFFMWFHKVESEKLNLIFEINWQRGFTPSYFWSWDNQQWFYLRIWLWMKLDCMLSW